MKENYTRGRKMKEIKENGITSKVDETYASKRDMRRGNSCLLAAQQSLTPARVCLLGDFSFAFNVLLSPLRKQYPKLWGASNKHRHACVSLLFPLTIIPVVRKKGTDFLDREQTKVRRHPKRTMQQQQQQQQPQPLTYASWNEDLKHFEWYQYFPQARQRLPRHSTTNIY